MQQGKKLQQGDTDGLDLSKGSLAHQSLQAQLRSMSTEELLKLLETKSHDILRGVGELLSLKIREEAVEAIHERVHRGALGLSELDKFIGLKIDLANEKSRILRSGAR